MALLKNGGITMPIFNALWSAVETIGNAIGTMAGAAFNAVGVGALQAIEVLGGVAKTLGLG